MAPGGAGRSTAASRCPTTWTGPSLLDAVAATGAERVWVTHGYTGPVVRWLRERGVDAQAVQTRFEGDADDDAAGPEDGGSA